MKTIRMIAALLFVGFMMWSPNLRAQDPMTVGKMYKKVLLENDKVRVMEVEFAPGEVMPWHSHPGHTVYALSGGKLEITDKDKAPVTQEIKTGDVMYMPPVTHMAKNVGTTKVKLVVTEIKSEM